MTFLTPRLRKLALTTHVASSVGWLGAVGVFLALALAGLAGDDPQTVRAADLAMGIVARTVIVPLAFAALATGILQSLGTEWGLLRHHWVVAKLLITIAATAILLLHLQPILRLEAAAAQGLAPAELRGVRVQLAVDAAAALVALLAATVLSVFKPRGLTRLGRRRRRQSAP